MATSREHFHQKGGLPFQHHRRSLFLCSSRQPLRRIRHDKGIEVPLPPTARKAIRWDAGIIGPYERNMYALGFSNLQFENVSSIFFFHFPKIDEPIVTDINDHPDQRVVRPPDDT